MPAVNSYIFNCVLGVLLFLSVVSEVRAIQLILFRMLPLPSTPAALALSGYFEVWSLSPCAFITLPVMGLAAYLITAELYGGNA